MEGLAPPPVTFLLTDIEGSTGLWEQRPRDAARLVEEHDRIIHEEVAAHNGRVFSAGGDSFASAFESGASALEAAVAAQLRLQEVVPVRMGLHAGPAQHRDGDYFGSTLNRCGRLRDAAHGGQIICSQAVVELIGHPGESGWRDLGEHRLKDLSRPEHIYQVTHRGLPADFPALNTLSTETTNLPIQLTSFIGRYQESAEVGKLLLGSRLVTLTGAAGSGKSRLAMEVAAQFQTAFPDGVWLVEFGSLADPELVGQSVTGVLGISDRTDSPIESVIVDHVRERRLLLVLDNCEHMIEPIANLISEVLSGAPQVKALATSREPLHARGEAIYEVPPMPLPQAGASPQTITRADAVRLFVERAIAARPDFHLTAQTAQIVASICRHLDGIPLAIELAAATTRFLKLDDIETRLDDRFRLLRHGARDDLKHHRTLQAAIDWSYDHLDPHQRDLFSRLAVFEGGWTLAAAEAVCTESPIEASEVLPLLEDLIDRSLVTVTGDGSTLRYGYLETIHTYAEQVEPVSDALRVRHAGWYEGFAERVRPWITADRTEDGLAAFRAELANLRAALRYLTESEDAAGYCRLLAALRRFLFINRSYVESDKYYTHALDILTDDLPAGLRGEILMGAGWNLSRGHGAHKETARHLLHRAVDLLIEAGDDRHLSEAYSYLTVLEDDPSHAERALEAGERSGDPTASARPHHYVGIQMFLSGRYEEALDHFRSAVEGLHSAHLTAFATIWAASTLARMGKTDEAVELAESALDVFTEISDTGGLETAFQTLCAIQLGLGDADAALEAMERRIEVWPFEASDPGGHAIAAHAAARAGKVDQSLDHLELVTGDPPADLLFEDSLDHTFLAASHLGLGHDDPELAAVALGAESKFRSTHDVLPDVLRDAGTDRLIEEARGLLGPQEFESAWQRGRGMTLENILELTLARFGRS